MDIISSNVYIFYEIFNYLNLKELLEAAKVCSDFRNVVTKILQVKYKQVQAFKTSNLYIVSNQLSKENDLNIFSITKKSKILLPKQENRILLSHGDFFDFLQLNSNNIETLLLHFNGEYEPSIQSSYYEDREYLCKFEFNKLKKLGFVKMNLTEKQINGIIENCNVLKELYCRGLLCENGDFDETTWFIHIPVNTLNNKKIIKCLGYIEVFLIDGYYSHREERFVRLEHLINELKKQTHLLKLMIEDNTTDNNLETKIKHLNVCEVFIEGQYISQARYNDFSRNILRKLINLRKLTIVGAHFINISKDFFIALNDLCKNFEYLEIEYCTVKEFVPINTLKELALFNCFGFCTRDLKTILSLQTNLKTFSSTLVDYKGDCEFFKISEKLQQLKLRYNDINNNIMPLLNLKNLTSLHWSSLNLSKQNWINSNNCSNLEILEVKTSHLIFDEINEFKCLKQLILNVSENLNESEFWHILQQPTIIYLTLNDDPEQLFMNYENFMAAQIENNYDWKIAIQYIDICFNNNAKDFFNFWLKLLSENLNLTLRIKYSCPKEYYDYNEDDCSNILENILQNAERPRNLKTINVCGCNIDLLVAAQVSNGFRNVIIKIFRSKYKEVYAFKTHYYYIVSNKIDKDFDVGEIRKNKFNFKLPNRENRIILTEEEFLKFANLNSKNFETLILHFNEKYDYNINGIYYDDKEKFSKLEFKQLKRIGFVNTNLKETHIIEFIKNCPQLKEIYCRGFPLEDTDDVESLMPKNALDKMNIMLHLGYVDVCLVDGNNAWRRGEFIKTEHLLTELTATSYVTNLIVENKNIETDLNQSNVCQVLTERQTVYQPMYGDFNRNILKNLTNLRKLLILSTIFTNISKDFFISLNNSCKHLEYLQLEFCYFKQFEAIKSLKELVLYNCLGLSANDLITILSQYTNLKSFSSTLVRYNGEYKSFKKISQTLQHLELRYNEMNNEIMSLLDLRNITSLIWSECVYEKQKWINPYNFENLEILEVKTSQILLKRINDFKCLKKLILNISETLNSDEFWSILQHPSLIYLALNDNPDYNFMNYESYLMEQIDNHNNWKIDIRFIDACFNNNGEKYFDFWLKLLATNLNLLLRIKPNCHQMDEEYDEVDDCVKVLMEIVNNEMCPSSLKSINICGYNIDLNKFYENFDETIEEASLISQDNHFNNKLQYILLENSKT